MLQLCNASFGAPPLSAPGSPSWSPPRLPPTRGRAAGLRPPEARCWGQLRRRRQREPRGGCGLRWRGSQRQEAALGKRGAGFSPARDGRRGFRAAGARGGLRREQTSLLGLCRALCGPRGSRCCFCINMAVSGAHRGPGGGRRAGRPRSSPARGAPAQPPSPPPLTWLARDGPWQGLDRRAGRAAGLPGGLWPWSRRPQPGSGGVKGRGRCRGPQRCGTSWLHGRLCYPEECAPRRRGGGPAPAAPRPRALRAGRGGVRAGERAAAAVAGPGPLCSPPTPVPAAGGSAILASRGSRQGGRHHHCGRCGPGSVPPERCCHRCPRPRASLGGGNGGFQGHFLSSGSF